MLCLWGCERAAVPPGLPPPEYERPAMTPWPPPSVAGAAAGAGAAGAAGLGGAPGFSPASPAKPAPIPPTQSLGGAPAADPPHAGASGEAQ